MSPISSPVTSIDLIIKIAQSYSWVREKGGQNKGEAVVHFLEEVDLSDPEPWCAAFVSTMGVNAFGADWPLHATASCANLGTDAKNKNLLFSLPVPGAVFLLWSEKKHRFHHTGFVTEPVDVSQHEWWTIEGNTNEGGSPEGIGVFRRRRMFSSLDRFVWWWRPM